MKWISLLLLLWIILYSFPTPKTHSLHEQPDVIEVFFKGHIAFETSVWLAKPATLKQALAHVSMLEDSDLSRLDFFKVLKHQEVITIYPKQKQACISINSASLEQLIQLKGIKHKKAQLIMKHRPYIHLDDLLKVKGIGSKTFENLKQYICL